MCDIPEGDGVAVWSEEKRKARKQYVCDGCGGPIKPGDKYVVTVCIVDRGDRPQRDRMCLPCEKDRDAFGDAHEIYPFPSTLAEMLGNCIAEGDEESDKKWRPMLEALKARRVTEGVGT